MVFKSLVISILITALIYSEELKDQVQKNERDIIVLKSSLDTLQQTVQERSSQAVTTASSELPLGTIVTSILSPTQFRNQLNNSERDKWVLADGNSYPRSAFADIVARGRVPDLRGMFLRGMNAGRNDGKQDPNNRREAGQYQPDNFKSHNHGGGNHNHSHQLSSLGSGGNAGGSYPTNTYVTRSTGNSGNVINQEGGRETRPKNVAVYYYIKIN